MPYFTLHSSNHDFNDADYKIFQSSFTCLGKYNIWLQRWSRFSMLLCACVLDLVNYKLKQRPKQHAPACRPIMEVENKQYCNIHCENAFLAAGCQVRKNKTDTRKSIYVQLNFEWVTCVRFDWKQLVYQSKFAWRSNMAAPSQTWAILPYCYFAWVLQRRMGIDNLNPLTHIEYEEFFNKKQFFLHLDEHLWIKQGW